MDLDGITKEVARIKDRLAAVGQNADEVLKGLTDEFTKCEPKVSETKMGFKFLASPKRILVDEHNRVRGLEMEDNKLDPKGEDTAAVGLKQYYEFPCDAVVFAVGDKVDETVGFRIRAACSSPIPTRPAMIRTTRCSKPMTKRRKNRRWRVSGRMGKESERRLGRHRQTGRGLVR